MTTTNKRAWNLSVGDHLVCPGDGQTETVLRVERRPGNRTFARTSRHDHNLLRTARVEVEDR